jgi:hypothetical protein
MVFLLLRWEIVMNVRRQLRAVAVAAIITANVFMLNTVSANAALGSSIRPSTTVTVTSTAQGPGIQAVITCAITVQNPHKSSHVPGTVNVISRVQCTAPVAGIAEAVGLYRNLALVSSNSASNTGVAALQVNTTTPCVNGNYDALGLATVYFPPGYSPPSGSIGAWSNMVTITC